MWKKIVAVFTALTLIMMLPAPPIQRVAYADTITCTLPSRQHNLVHDISITSNAVGARFYCSTCGIAYVEIVAEEFHPEGAPSGVTAARPKPVYHNLSSGIMSERCADANCTAMGPHYKCACGTILSTPAEVHSRQRELGPSIQGVTKNISSDEYSVRLNKGTKIGILKNADCQRAPIIIEVNGAEYRRHDLGSTAINTVMPEDGTLTIKASGWLKIWGDRGGTHTYAVSASYILKLLDSKDSNGVYWNLPEITGYDGMFYDGASYSDGVTVRGGYCEVDSSGCLQLNKTFSGYNTYTYKIKASLTAGQRIVMHTKGSYYKYGTYSQIVLTDLNGKILASSEIISHVKEDWDSYVEVYAPSSGEYYIVPLNYHTESSAAYWPCGTGSVTVYTENLVVPSQQLQTISATLSSTSIGYGSTPPTLSVAGAKTSLSYKSSDTNVATISNTGIITIKGLGSTTFTVTAAETSSYKSATSTVALTIIKGDIATKQAPAAVTINYGQLLSAAGLSGGQVINSAGQNVGGSWVWKAPNEFPTVGKFSYVARFTPTDKTLYNY